MTDFVENLLKQRIENVTRLHKILDAVLVTTVNKVPDEQLQMTPAGNEFSIKYADGLDAKIVMNLHDQHITVAIVQTETNATIAVHVIMLSGESGEQWNPMSKDTKIDIMNFFMDLDTAVESVVSGDIEPTADESTSEAENQEDESAQEETVVIE